MIEWKSCVSNPPIVSGEYLVTVDTDSGREVHVLEYSSMRKHWLHECEPTYCKGRYFRQIFWSENIEPCSLDAENDDE